VPLRLPQARDLDKLRRLLELLATGVSDLDAVGRAMGAGSTHARRHASYYREAAEILGLVDRGSVTVTARGAALLGAQAGGDAERSVLRAAIHGAADLGGIREAILAADEPDAAAIVSSVAAELPELSFATIERRVRDTLSWRRRVHASAGDVTAPASYDTRAGAVQLTMRPPAAAPRTARDQAGADERTARGRDRDVREQADDRPHGGRDHGDPPRDLPRRPARPASPAPARRDPHRLLAGLARDRVALTLETVDVCFLAALHLRSEVMAAVELDEDVLVDVFEQICDLVDVGAENPRKRATHAIQRLRDQRLLARVDGAGFVRAGTYALTSLASAIVEFYLEDDRLTRESLALLTGAVIGSLGEIRSAARQARSAEDWQASVVAPLRITVGDLVAGIERRQRGLDAQQEEIQRQIGALLETGWFEAVQQCQEILESTTRTLRELNEVLLRDSHQIQTLLQELLALASTAEMPEVEDAVGRVVENVDRMAAWGLARQDAWSKYYRFAHRFLRDVVRLDPARALSRRLVEQLRQWPADPFFLVAANEGRIAVLRPIEARIDRPVVEQTRRDRERAPEAVDAAEDDENLEPLVLQALHAGASELSDVTARVLVQLPEVRRYAAAGTVAALVATHAEPKAARPRPWTPIDETLQIEDWTLARRRPAGKP
jgi:chromosome partition protein MukF